jgi:hypothetical protein
MKKKVIAYLTAIVAGAATAFAVYYLLGYVLGYIAFITPILAALAFIAVYKAVAKEEPNLIGIIIACTVVAAGGTFLSMFIVSGIIYDELIAQYGALTAAEQSAWDSAVLSDIIFNAIACVVTVVYFICNYIVNKKKQADWQDISLKSTAAVGAGTAADTTTGTDNTAAGADKTAASADNTTASPDTAASADTKAETPDQPPDRQ